MPTQRIRRPSYPTAWDVPSRSCMSALVRADDVAAIMRSAREDVLAYMAHPAQLWPVLASTNSLERLNCELKRRADVVQIFPNDASVLRLLGALLLDQHEEWQVARRQLSQQAMGRPSTKYDAFLARGIETGT